MSYSHSIGTLASAALLALVVTAAPAQSYPSKSI